jgi:hypothetical protein
MGRAILFTVLVLGSTAALAQSVDLDVAFVANGENVVLGDEFDNGVIEPFWTQIGSPGPEHGTVLDLDPGDALFSPFIANPELFTIASATFDVPALEPGAFLLVLLASENPADTLGLGVNSTSVFLFNESAVLGSLDLGSVPSRATLTVGALPDGTVFAQLNDQAVFNGPDTFGPAATATFGYLPEPGAGLALLLGIASLARSARPRR